VEDLTLPGVLADVDCVDASPGGAPGSRQCGRPDAVAASGRHSVISVMKVLPEFLAVFVRLTPIVGISAR
jgi:hypothetical protein